MIRFLIAVFIIISVIIANIQYRGGITLIAQLMGISWGALAGAFLAPFMYGLYWRQTTNIAVWCNFIFATVFMLANIFFRGTFPVLLRSPINAGAFTMLAGLVIVPAVSFITPKPDKKTVDHCFACYETVVSVKTRESLGV